MSQQTLKELLKPPFRYDCGRIFDSNNQIFCKLQLLMPGLGELIAAALNEKWELDFYDFDEGEAVTCFECKYYFVDEKDLDRCKLKGMTVTVDPEEKEPCLGYEHKKFIPLRWLKNIGYHSCPKCKKVFNDERNPIKGFDFCPYCGQPLDQPLEELLIGEKVKMVKCLEAEKYKDRVWVVASEPWKVGDSWVVRLNGYSGGFDIECLEVVK